MAEAAGVARGATVAAAGVGRREGRGRGVVRSAALAQIAARDAATLRASAIEQL